jgi:CheY-like chemotaxis protein
MRAAIFVVDDHRDSAEAVAAVLRHAGHDVSVETSGARAAAIMLSDAQFDVTFLDLLMPDVSGGEIYQMCKRAAPARLRRICFFTGAAHLIPEWIRETGLPVIDKPSSAGLLEKTVRDFAELSAPRGPRPDMPPKKHPDHSHPELPALYDEEVEVTTDIIEIAEKLPGVSKEAMQELRVRYLHRAVSEMKPVVDDIQDIKKTLRFLVRFMPIAAAAAGGIFETVRWLLDHVVLK